MSRRSGCSTKLYTALCLLTLVCSTLAQDASAVRPHFSSMFVAITPTTAAWTLDEWITDFASMRRVGMDFVIIPHTGRQVSPPTDSCPQGLFETYYPPPSGPCFSQIGANNSSSGTLGNIMAAAKASNMTGVHLGLMFAPSEHGFPSQTRNGTFANWGKFQGGTVAAKLQELYGETRLLTGFYTEIEFNNGEPWMQALSSFGRDYLGSIAAAVASLPGGADIQVWASPYSIGNITRQKGLPDKFVSPAKYALGMRTAVDAAGTGFHHVAMQDSMGAQGNSFENASDFLGNMSQQVTTWANVELFEVWPPSCQWPDPCHGRHPAPFSRIQKQMANEARALGGAGSATLIAWEWYSCFSPNAAGDPHHPFPAEARANYEAYLKYLSLDQ